MNRNGHFDKRIIRDPETGIFPHGIPCGQNFRQSQGFCFFYMNLIHRITAAFVKVYLEENALHRGVRKCGKTDRKMVHLQENAVS